MHMINRSSVMLSRCHSHRMCFCVDAGSGIGKIQEDVSKHLLITRVPHFRKRFHARDASATVKRVHVYIEKTTEQQRNQIQNLRRNLLYMYCTSDLSGLHQGDRLRTAVHCFTEPL